jgi:hypothetical protein
MKSSQDLQPFVEMISNARLDRKAEQARLLNITKANADALNFLNKSKAYHHGLESRLLYVRPKYYSRQIRRRIQLLLVFLDHMDSRSDLLQ